jgi:subfamily B ATP-binding cassette protein MsbA
VQRAIGWKVKENTKTIRDRLSMLSGNIQEKLAASTIVKTFTREEDEVQRFLEDSSSLVDLSVSNARLSGISEAVNHAVKMTAQLLVIAIGGYIALYHDGNITPGLVIQFILMQGQLYMPFEWLNEMQLIIAAAMGATDRIFTIMDTEPEVADTPHARPAPRFAGEIGITDVTFRYPEAASPVLTGFSLQIPARTTTALVGPSGGGKTTVTHLLNRFYEWEAGDVRIDGRPVRDYTIASLRAQIGLVPQEPMLFSGTIEQNILYGRPDAAPADVRRAAEQAYALEFINDLDDGFDTLLGERGIRLSGGQKQRIAIARAFLKDPAILILDEATSALDSESERIVQQALEALMRARTTIVIAHRLATVLHADQIAVIDGGRVVECGRHTELLAHNGLYAMLCRQQFGQVAGLPILD